MDYNTFAHPQRQSKIGILLIFLTKIFNLLKGFWALAAYFLFTKFSVATLLYMLLGFVIIAVISLIYSYVYYHTFLFHIDSESDEFVLEKGVFTKEKIAIPFDKIQQVYLKRSILQRLLNVDSFIIETAGSKEEEIKIQAISSNQANQLLSLLTKARGKHTEKTTDSETPNSDKYWTHKLSFLSLLKIGISTNYLRGLVLIVGFFATIYNEISTLPEEHSENIQQYLNQLPGPMESVTISVAIVISVLVMSILITVTEVFIKYFNLQLTQTKDSLQLEMGIKTNTKVSLQPRRVQLLQLITNPVQKWLNLYQVRISLANTENDLQKSKIKIPGLDQATVIKMNSFLFTDSVSRFNENFKPDKILLIRRLLIALLPVVVSYFYMHYANAINFSTWLLLVFFYSLIVIIWQMLAFKSLNLNITEDFIFKKYGVWNKTEERIEIYKLQSISVHQPMWYRKRRLLNIVFHTAGGDVSYKAVKKDLLPYLNYMLYKIEADKRSWM